MPSACEVQEAREKANKRTRWSDATLSAGPGIEVTDIACVLSTRIGAYQMWEDRKLAVVAM